MNETVHETNEENKGKQCMKCKEVKPLSEFSKRKTSKDGRRGECKKCTNKYNREYSKEYRKTDKYKERVKKYYKTKARKESVRKYKQSEKGKASAKRCRESETRKKYLEANKERIREWNKQYEENNKERRKEYKKEYREDNKEKIREYDIQYRIDNAKRLAEWRKQHQEVNKERLKKWAKQYYEQLRISFPEVVSEKQFCQECGAELTIGQIRSQQLYCSTKCSGLAGRKPEAQILRSSFRGYNWEFKSKRARDRDECVCQVCGETEGKRAHPVHHIIPWHEFEDKSEANDNYNLITLCFTCHMKHENDESYRIIFLETAFLNELLFQGKNKEIEITVGAEK